MNRTNLFVKIAMVFIIGVSIFTIVRLQVQFNDLNTQRKQLLHQVEEYTEMLEQKTEMLEEPFDDEYVIRVAREKLGYHLPDEIIYFNDLN